MQKTWLCLGLFGALAAVSPAITDAQPNTPVHPLAPIPPTVATDFAARAAHIKNRLQTQWLPYWEGASDPKGGYILADDGSGKRGTGYGSDGKGLVTQARMVWAFSHAHLLGYSTPDHDYLKAAKHGYQFLRDVMRDKTNGGFFYQVDLKNQPINPRKSVYAQAFAVYALVEYARASKEPEAKAMAIQTWRSIRDKAGDKINGGYYEHFTRDWRLITDTTDQGAVPEVPGLKSGNCHLHLMEACAELYDLTHDQSIKRDLLALVDLNEGLFFPADVSHTVSLFTPNWHRADNAENDVYSYGHIIEAAWLLVHAHQILGDRINWVNVNRRIDEVMQGGYDFEHGGIFQNGSLDGKDRRDYKEWWSQYEALNSLSMLAKAVPAQTQRPAQIDQLLDWIENVGSDPKDFVPYDGTDGAGKVTNPSKAGYWKANYHDGRALMDFVAAWENKGATATPTAP